MRQQSLNNTLTKVVYRCKLQMVYKNKPGVINEKD